MSHRLGLVANPTSGGGRGAAATRELTGLLGAAGHRVVDLSGSSAAESLGRARAAVAEGDLDALVVVGGDGMAHLGVNACAGTPIPLAIVPCGTGNDIAAGLGFPAGHLARAAAAIGELKTRSIDAARRDGDGECTWFAGSVYAGFDAIVNARANGWTWPRGQMRYNLALLRELPVFRAIPYLIEVDGRRVETEAMLVVVANAPSYGGGMKVVPTARMDDGQLDVLILHRISRIELLRVFPRVFSGGHVDHPAVELLRGTQVRLVARRIPVFADGEPFGAMPLTACVVPGAVQVVAP